MIFLILLLLACSMLVGLIGRRRKFGFWGYFLCSLFFTPLVGLVLVLASDPKQQA